MKTPLSYGVALICILLTVGCSASSPDIDKDYMSDATKLGQDVKTMFDRTGGDYSKLTAEEKKRYVESFGGNEGSAADYWQKMKAGAGAESRPIR